MNNLKDIYKLQWEALLTKPNTGAASRWHKISDILKQRPEIFLDIGPGEHGSEAWAVKETDPNCKIIGFEPQPNRFQLLKQYNYPGQLRQFVISNSNQKIKGYMGYDGGKSDFWLFAEDEPDYAYQEIEIQSYKLDSLEPPSDPFSDIFIWADVEGGELSVLKSAERLFDENKVIGINVEVRDGTNPSATRCTSFQIIEFLNTKHFFSFQDNAVGKRDILFLKGNN